MGRTAYARMDRGRHILRNWRRYYWGGTLTDDIAQPQEGP